MNIPPPDPDPPWKLHEKLELLTEVIKSANVHPDFLLPLVKSLPTPAWLHVPLPRGRSLYQCQLAYEEMLQPPTPLSAIPGVLSRSASLRDVARSLDTNTASKRPHSMVMSHTPASALPQYQDIQAKPQSGVGSAGATRPPSTTDEPPKKRRGRPPKAETELRRATVQARQNLLNTQVTTQGLQPLQPLLPLQPVQVMQSGRGPPLHSPLLPTPTSTAAQAAQAVMNPTTSNLAAYSSSATAADQAAAQKRRARLESIETARREPLDTPESDVKEDDSARARTHSAHDSQILTAPSPARGYPDILSGDPSAGPSSFRAPRGGNA